jgi:hypothetical protein
MVDFKSSIFFHFIEKLGKSLSLNIVEVSIIKTLMKPRFDGVQNSD